MQQSVDVIVNGAGPVGLFCAYMLIKDGLSVYLADKKDGPTEQSRALGISPRSLEVLQHHGIGYRFLQDSIVVRGGYLHVNGYDMGMVHFPETDCVFPQMTSLAQSNVEQILVEEVVKLQGGAIYWGTELVDYEQHGDHVLARYKSNDEGMIQVSAKYIVGADGCHSKVRKQDPTWTYDGHAIKSRFAMADLVLDGRDVAKIKDRQTIFYHAKGGCFFLPLPHKSDDGKISVRVVANMGAYDVDDGPRVSHGLETSGAVLTLEKVKEIINERMVGLETNIVSSSWISYFYINERIANGFRRGRAFVIGDAAHCHSPAGGQGMNIGFHDAENLAWKLSLVLKETSSDPEKVLDSFSIERVPLVQAVLDATSALTKLALGQTYFLSFLRQAAIVSAMIFPSIGKKLASKILQVDINLGTSPILDASGSRSSLIQPGSFLKDTHALLNKNVSHGVVRRTIYQILEGMNTKHAVFWMMCRQTWQQEPDPELTQTFLRRISGYQACQSIVVQSAMQYGKFEGAMKKDKVERWIDTHALSTTESLTGRIGFTQYLAAFKGTVPPVALIVLRPDRYVTYSGLISTEVELDAAFTFLDGYLL